MGPVIIGVDVGKQHDPTAIAVVEAATREVEGNGLVEARQESVFLTRWLDRLPLGTSYPIVARRLIELLLQLRKRTGRDTPIMRVDATGVGSPVIDLLRAQGIDRLCSVTAVTFTATDRWEDRGNQAGLGKEFLVSRLQALLQTRRIKLPDTDEARALAKELQDYEIRVGENGKITAGAMKSGAHDDLVTALGLAVLQDPSRLVPSGIPKSPRHRGPLFDDLLNEGLVGF